MFRKFDPLRRYALSRVEDNIDHKFGLTSTDIVNLYNFATMEFPEPPEGAVEDDKLDEVFLPYIEELKLENEEFKRSIRDPNEGKIFPKVKIPDHVMT